MKEQKMGTGLTIRNETDIELANLKYLATSFAKSGYFQDAKEEAQAVVKIMAGREMGLSAVYSMTKIYIVKGKIMVGAEALGAMVKRSGRYDYRVKSLTDTECLLEFTDDNIVVYTSRFTFEDAKRADLLKQDSGWFKWPRAMLMSKALSQGARIVCPHVIAGAYTPADFAVETNEEGEPTRAELDPEARVKGLSPGKVIKEGKPTIVKIDEEAQENIVGRFINVAQKREIGLLVREQDIEAGIQPYLVATFKKEHTSQLLETEAQQLIDAIKRGDIKVGD